MSSVQNQQTIIPIGTIWQYKIVVTQPVGVPDPMGFTLTVPEGERCMLLGGVIGPDNYGAGRVITAYLIPKGETNHLYSLGVDTIDNQQMQLAPIITNPTGTSSVVAIVGVPYMPFIMPELSVIQVHSAAMLNTETITGTFYIASRILPLIVAAVGASVTLTTNTRTQV